MRELETPPLSQKGEFLAWKNGGSGAQFAWQKGARTRVACPIHSSSPSCSLASNLRRHLGFQERAVLIGVSALRHTLATGWRVDPPEPRSLSDWIFEQVELDGPKEPSTHFAFAQYCWHLKLFLSLLSLHKVDIQQKIYYLICVHVLQLGERNGIECYLQDANSALKPFNTVVTEFDGTEHFLQSLAEPRCH